MSQISRLTSQISYLNIECNEIPQGGTHYPLLTKGMIIATFPGNERGFYG